jgi:hypothetical protein
MAASVSVALLVLSSVRAAEVPPLLNYQGRLQVGTVDFNGSGQFKFALVSADGTTTYWSNDGTASGQPAAGVTLPVTKGLYSVLLGDTALPNMSAVPPTVFTNPSVHLRVWFDDGVNGFQQFVPDQRIAAAAYAVTAGSLTGPIRPEQLPPGVLRETNGTTTVSGNVVVQGTLTAAGLNTNGMAGSSGLPAGTTLEVLINNVVVPGIRFEGLKFGGPWEIRLSRPSTDLSWPAVFYPGPAAPWTNPPVAIRLSLPNGGQITWSARGSGSAEVFPSYEPRFSHPIGRDGKPFDRVVLLVMSYAITRSEISLSAAGTVPSLPFEGPSSGQPQGSALRLIVDGVNYNNVVVQGEIDPTWNSPLQVVLNPTFHRALSQWVLEANDSPTFQRGVEVLLVNGLAGIVSLANRPYDGDPRHGAGVGVRSYELRLATDGLPYEVIAIGLLPLP